jgi:hypothetical protein
METTCVGKDDHMRVDDMLYQLYIDVIVLPSCCVLIAKNTAKVSSNHAFDETYVQSILHERQPFLIGKLELLEVP